MNKKMNVENVETKKEISVEDYIKLYKTFDYKIITKDNTNLEMDLKSEQVDVELNNKNLSLCIEKVDNEVTNDKNTDIETKNKEVKNIELNTENAELSDSIKMDAGDVELDNTNLELAQMDLEFNNKNLSCIEKVDNDKNKNIETENKEVKNIELNTENAKLSDSIIIDAQDVGFDNMDLELEQLDVELNNKNLSLRIEKVDNEVANDKNKDIKTENEVKSSELNTENAELNDSIKIEAGDSKIKKENINSNRTENSEDLKEVKMETIKKENDYDLKLNLVLSDSKNAQIFPEQLKVYYRRIFPYHTFCRWLEYKHEVNLYKYTTFQHREFSFTLDGDIYSRYNSYKTREDFIQDVQRLNPIKIDLGSEYNRPPKDIFKLVPARKEVVIDIDLTDYDDVRKCCKNADVCQKCWKYMNLACKIIDCCLKDDFGFVHLLWVFSGRRGIHCWVCDDVARKLDYRSRSAVVEYLHINNDLKKLIENRRDNSPFFPTRRALQIIDKYFVNICLEDQKLLETSDDVQKLLNLMPDKTFISEFKTEMMKCDTSVERWTAFVQYFQHQLAKNKLPMNMRYFIEYIKLKWCYPRLDVEVTKGVNHLLKSPFCVHPKTGKICVPINPKIIDKFNPENVPVIDTILDEINAFDAKLDPQIPNFKLSSIKDARKTSLIKSLVVFEQFVSKLDRENVDGYMEF